MEGEKLKNKIAGTGYNITEVAKLIGTSQQNLSKSLSSLDIKTGLVEKIAKALKLPISYFFDEDNNNNVVASGNFSAASVHGDASVKAEGSELLKERIKSLEQLVEEKDKMIDEKERTIKILMGKN